MAGAAETTAGRPASDDEQTVASGPATQGDPPRISPTDVREAVLALEGAVVEDLVLPLPGDLKDIAKAAALVSGVVEDRIPDLLNRVRSTTWDVEGKLHAYEFRRFTIGFPDILLVERANPENVIFELEAKSWYILASDALTARFLTSTDVIDPGTLVIIVAWVLDGVVSGSPILQRIHIDDAQRLATIRDEKWVEINPQTHRVVQPENAVGTPRNLIKTQARGEILQGGDWKKDSDNYGKLDRIYDEQLKNFKRQTLGLRAAGKTLGSWKTFIFS